MATADRYEPFFRIFDAPLMRELRQEAYGEDIGQHSWVTADDLRADIGRLGLTPTSRIVDLGCGPGGPLTFMLATVGCRGTGVDLSPSALDVARTRARALGVEPLLDVHEGDLDEPLRFDARTFDAAVSFDVVLHLRDRAALFREVKRVLRPGGRFLFTEAGVLTGCVSSDDVRRRSGYGYTQFAPPGVNERLLEAAGFRVLATEDRTASVVRNAGGRLAAIERRRAELETILSTADVERQRRALETVLDLAGRTAVSRWMYLAD